MYRALEPQYQPVYQPPAQYQSYGVDVPPFFATNATWPAANQWHNVGGRTAKYRASLDEMRQAREVEAQEAARQEAKRLKKQLWTAIVQVGWRHAGGDCSFP